MFGNAIIHASTTAGTAILISAGYLHKISSSHKAVNGTHILGVTLGIAHKCGIELNFGRYPGKQLKTIVGTLGLYLRG